MPSGLSSFISSVNLSLRKYSVRGRILLKHCGDAKGGEDNNQDLGSSQDLHSELLCSHFSFPVYIDRMVTS